MVRAPEMKAEKGRAGIRGSRRHRKACGWFATVDHKQLGIRYLVTAFIFLAMGGLEALLMRLQLARSDMALLSPEEYNQMFTLHGATIIFWYASPILSGFAVYLVPLMIGARDMAFPRLNAFTYWTYLLSGTFLYISPIIGQSPHAGWFDLALARPFVDAKARLIASISRSQQNSEPRRGRYRVSRFILYIRVDAWPSAEPRLNEELSA